MSSRNLSHSGTQDEVEYMSLTSGNIDFDNLERPERLHEWLKKEEIESLHRTFVTHKLQKLNYGELRDALLDLNINFTDFEYNRLFLKINQNRDFMCDWDEFVSYLIFGFQEDDPSTQKEALIQPISQPPLIRKSEHRSAICAMTLMRPNIEDEDEEVEDGDMPSNIASDVSPESLGMWLTASREGYIRFWNTFLESIRSGKSESIHLKMQTWILAIQALSDVSIVCTASTERELRFHEVVASTFTLRIVIRSMPFAVCNMSYRFHSKGKVDSKLVLGDYGGNVRVLEFNPFLRGPFQSKPGAALVEIYWSDILKGKLPLFKAREYINMHTELIQETFYSLRLNSLFAAAEYRNTRKYRGRCPGLIVANGDDKTVFRIPLGVSTFFVDERNNIVVTGGPDTFVRIWDVYISSKPSGILTGHNSGVVMVFVQPDEKKVYSIDYQKIIKVWHLNEHTLLQTYGDLARIISPSETDLVYSYHEVSRELIIGGRKLIALKCSPRIRVDLTDGNTHAQPVSVVLYNRLFRNVVTCGLDSYIIVWDPYSGKRKIIMKSCHTRMVYGEIIDIEITAGCFDPLEQFLLTGARDGSLKIWNYNNAVCIRNMSIKAECEVTAVIWVVERILAVGWDKKVTEFNDVEGREYGDPKIWMQFHSDDITCADVKLGEGVVTATYSGEIIFWKLETGQPYRRYSVSEPTRFIELKHSRDDDEEDEQTADNQLAAPESHINVQRFVRRSISVSIRTLENKYHKKSQKSQKRGDKFERSDIDDDTASLGTTRSLHDGLPLSVQAVLFLQTRPMVIGVGSVFVALDTGLIQVYSHHQRGGYITEFNSIHKTGDCVLTMATDRKNRYLFTGTAFGYIKVWHIENYCIPEDDKKKVCMPLMRLQFIFLRKERFATRAKRVVRHQPDPMLVSSYKAHLKAITSIVYIDLPKILISGSYDCSCRLWTLGGRYLGTLGTPLPWMRLSPFEAPQEDRVYRLPPDIQKVASSTTIKVISGVQNDQTRFKYHPEKKDDPTEDDQVSTRVFGRPLQDPVLGKHFALPGLSATEQRIEVDLTAQSTQVFTHLKVHEAEDLERPPTPPHIKRVAAEEYMEFYMPQPKSEEQVNELNEDLLTKATLSHRKSELRPQK